MATKKIFEQYTMSNYTSDSMSTLRTGYHNWNDGQWLTNLCSFVKLQNRRLTVPKSNHKYNVDFSKFMHEDLRSHTEIDDQENIIKYNPDNEREFNFHYDNTYIRLDNKLFGLMCKVNDNTEFYFIARKHVLYLYTYCKVEHDYIFQGMILGIKEGTKTN